MYTAKQISQSKTPQQFIDRCLHTKVLRGQKGLICIDWLKKTGYTNDDVKHARHRHPYWKAQKLKGGQERNKKRMKLFNFYGYKVSQHWTPEKIKRFMYLNKKEADGKYMNTDVAIASVLKTSIASVQYWRRKFNMIEKLVGSRRVDMMSLATQSEHALRTKIKRKKE